jgi:hypothetical protein
MAERLHSAYTSRSRKRDSERMYIGGKLAGRLDFLSRS